MIIDKNQFVADKLKHVCEYSNNIDCMYILCSYQ